MARRPTTASLTTRNGRLSVAIPTNTTPGVPARPGDGDPRCAIDSIELELKDIGQLFNSLDPSPFKERDLDRDAEEFIVGWARELRCAPRDTVKLILHFENPLPPDNSPGLVQEAVRHYFAYRADMNRLDFRQLLKQGRRSLVVGLSFLSICLLISQLIARHTDGTFSSIVQESLTIAGWVAMWRPMEIYLYDWWPVKRRGVLLEQLSRIQIEVREPKPSRASAGSPALPKGS
jgi:hypothetical protein